MTGRTGALRGLLLAVAATGLMAQALPWAGADTSAAGSAGTDTALPSTASAMTVAGRGRYAGLKVTVNQTASLVNQAVSVTWTGGVPTTSGFQANFLQVFQCWGNDDGTIPANPGPAPEQCEFGGAAITSTTLPDNAPTSNVYTRVVSDLAWPGVVLSQGFADRDTGKLWKPFRAVDGTVINAETKLSNTNKQFVSVSWQNPYFDVNNTNEEPWGKTFADGTGSALFQVDTGLEARGLGCGQKSEVHPDGSTTVPKCWLVIVPRGTAVQENPAGLNFPYVATSALAPIAWANRIAIPLQVNPVDSPCPIGADPRRIVGSELAAPAVVNWQPKLCTTAGSPPYAFAAIPDGRARQEISGGAPGAAGMAVVSLPLDTATADPANPVVYAPISLSGLVIGFNIERRPNANGPSAADQAAENLIAGVRVKHVNLTPRLMAKLLTESYRTQVDVQGGPLPASYAWVQANPGNLLVDPDFLQFNPEFKILSTGSPRTASGLVVEQPESDGASQLWRWVLADHEAADWLAGAADSWGMKVNPIYSTNAKLNPNGAAFGTPLPQNFPKNDSYCFHDTSPGDLSGTPPQPPRQLCSLDWAPYALNMSFAAQATRAANDGAKDTHDLLNPNDQTSSTWWISEGPEIPGSRSILSVTDAASAARYGLQTASLSRAGDDGATRSFASPDNAGLLAGEKAMGAGSVPAVLEPNPSTSTAGAYPLTMLTYAATTPRSLDAAARKDYAAFVDYAAGDGQTTGLDFGQLPPAYVPLPADLRAQAKSAADLIRTGDPAPPSTPTTTATTTTSVAAAAHSSSQVSPRPAPTGTALAAPPAVTPTPTQKSPTTPLASVGSIARTMMQGVGTIRYLLPLCSLVALAAGVGAWSLSRRRQNQARPNDSN